MSLHDVELPSASSVANALVELAEPRLAKAWTYLADWDQLEAARVPAPFRRELLDRDAAGEPDRETESVLAIREWDRHGARAPRVLVGQLGVGKSYGAARWVHDRARRGQSSLWVSVSTWSALDFDSLRAEQRRALAATALVVDDLGVGGSMYKLDNGKRVLSMIGESVQSMLLDRTNEGRKTLVLLNGDPKAALAMLGRRLIDRLKLQPGKPVVVIESRESLRRPLPDDDIDSAGRGRTYRRALVLLETFGATNVSGQPVHFRFGERVLATDPIFGGGLITRLTMPTVDWVGEAERARKLVGLDVHDVVERARLIQRDTESGFAAEAMALLSAMQAGVKRDRQKQTAELARKAVDAVRQAQSDRARAQRHRDDQGTWRDGYYGQLDVPPLDVGKLRDLGYRVQINGDGRYDIVRKHDRGKTEVLSLDHATETDAWDLANAVARGQLPDKQRSSRQAAA